MSRVDPGQFCMSPTSQTLYSYTSLTSVYNILQLTHSCLLVSATGRPGPLQGEHWHTVWHSCLCVSPVPWISWIQGTCPLSFTNSPRNRTIPDHTADAQALSSWIFMANVCLRSSMMIQKPRGIANDCNARKKLIHTDRILIYPLVPRQGCIWNDTSLKSLSVGNQLPSQPAAHERCSSNSSSRICSLHPFSVEKYGKVWKS